MIELDKASFPYLPYPYMSIPTDLGRKLFYHTPGPIVYSQLAYLTQAITLNDRMFDFGYAENFYDQQYQQQQLQPRYSMKHFKDQRPAQQIYTTQQQHIVQQQQPHQKQQQQQPEKEVHEKSSSFVHENVQSSDIPIQGKQLPTQHRQASPTRTTG